MVVNPDRGRVPTECQSYVLAGLLWGKKGTRMLAPSQTQGVVLRPMTPHTLTVHMFCIPSFPKYKPMLQCILYIKGLPQNQKYTYSLLPLVLFFQSGLF